MFTEVKTFLDDSGRDLTPATWRMPNGETVLVCRGKDGFHLYNPSEWNNALVASYGADRDGHVLLHGEYVAYDHPDWVVPERVREKSVR